MLSLPPAKVALPIVATPNGMRYRVLWREENMPYLEDLPEQCPPANAKDQQFGPAYRILPKAEPAIEHFYSYSKLGLTKPGGVDECRYRSCSMFTNILQARAIATLPKKRATSTHLAKVVVQAGFGTSWLNSKTDHVDFWPYDTFDVAAAVTEVVPV